MSAYFESLEFLRLGKTNLTYINYPEADHGFNRSAIVNGHTENTNKIDKAFHTALNESKLTKLLFTGSLHQADELWYIHFHCCGKSNPSGIGQCTLGKEAAFNQEIQSFRLSYICCRKKILSSYREAESQLNFLFSHAMY